MEKLWASRKHPKESSKRLRSFLLVASATAIGIFVMHILFFIPQASKYINVSLEDNISSLLVFEGIFVGIVCLAYGLSELGDRFQYRGSNIVLYKEGLELKGKFMSWSDVRQIRIVSQVGEGLLRDALVQTGNYAVASSRSDETLVGVKGKSPMTRETSINDLPGFIRTIKELGMENRLIFANQFKTMVGLGHKSDYEKELSKSR